MLWKLLRVNIQMKLFWIEKLGLQVRKILQKYLAFLDDKRRIPDCEAFGCNRAVL